MSKFTLFLIGDIFLNGKKNAGMPSLYMLLEKHELSGCKGAVFTTEKGSNIDEKDSHKYSFFKRPFKLNKTRIVNFILELLNYLYLNVAYFYFAASILKKTKHKKVIYTTIDFAIAAFLLRVFFKDASVIVRFYGVFSSYRLESKRKLLPLYKEVLAFKLPADKYIITNDGTSGDVSSRHFGIPQDKIWFVINGVNKSPSPAIFKQEIRSKLNILDQEMFVFCASRLTGWKKVERAIKAVAGLDNVKLIIAGDGDLRDYYEGISDNKNTVFLGLIENELVRKYMLACDLFVSLYDLSNIGNPVLEALYNGKAILTYDSGQTSSFINRELYNGILIPSSKSEDVIESNVRKEIIRLRDNPEIITSLELNAKKYSDLHLLSWDERLEKECQVISSM